MTTDGSISSAALASQYLQLQQENELLRAQRQQLLEQQQQKDRTIASMQQQLQYLLRRLFGRSAEKLDPKQLQLFNALLNELAPPAPTPTEPASETLLSAASRSTNGHGRRRLPADLPRQSVIHDLPEEEKPCPGCGQMRHVISQEVSEQLDYVPARLTVIEHVRLTYACRQCEQQAAEQGPQMVTAPKPLAPIEKGLAAPGLLAYVIVSKYSDHLPLHRLERILERHGIRIPRSTTCDWMAQSAAALRPLYDLMVQRVLQSKVIHTDDTPVDVLDRDRTSTRTGRFWVYLGDADHPFTVLTYTPSRSRDGPHEFLKGWGQDQGVYLQADAFGGYDGIYAGQAGGQVTEVACWAHARRKFYQAHTSDAALSTQALAYIRLLYDVEEAAKEQFQQERQAAQQGSSIPKEQFQQERQAAQQGASIPKEQFQQERQAAQQASSIPDQDPRSQVRPSAASAALPPDLAAAQRRRAAIRLALRQESAAPRLQQFRAWLQSQQAQHGGPVLPKSPLGEAITYAFNQWDALTVYTTDGDLAIDNNASENALRRVALGRKNWLFCGSDNGGHTAAVLFSVIATCQRHKVEPLTYLRDVLTRIAAHPMSRLAELLPTTHPPA